VPFVRIEAVKGKSSKFKSAVMDGVQDALLRVMNISDASKIEQFFYELEPENVRGRAAVKNGLAIEVKIYHGRPPEIKKAFLNAIADNLKNSPGIDPGDIIVNIVEIGPEDLGIW
jgi:phenylpyruvate tautomerase PptA (4-oxalocrotonate tautomerase family)